jgi:hypothetical protein
MTTLVRGESRYVPWRVVLWGAPGPTRERVWRSQIVGARCGAAR